MLLDARHAPRSPEVDDGDVTLAERFFVKSGDLGIADLHAFERPKLGFRSGFADQGRRQLGWIAGRQRKGERRSIRDMGPWQDFGLRMLAVRGRYQMSKSWDGVAEYRWLSDIDGNNERHGALLTLYRQLGDNLKVGVGFNFTNFNDQLRIDNYNSRGWFVDIIGMY